MKKEQIDNFFVRVKKTIEADRQDEDEQLLIEFLKVSSKKAKEELGNKNIYEFQEEDFNILLKDIMEQIQESKLYEYFLQKGIEKENIRIFELMLPENIQLPVEMVEKIIKDNNLLAEVDDVVSLIQKTKDIEFIKRCVKDKNLNISEGDRGILIDSISDKDFIKECILDENVKIQKWQMAELIKSMNDIEFIKECIQNKGLELLSSDKVELIKSTNDVEYIKKCIQDERLVLESFEKIELIQSTNDIEFIKACIQDEGLELESWDKVKLIQSVNDIEFIDECIRNKKVKLEKQYKIRLIQSTNDIEFIKECIRDERLELDGWDKVELIKSTNDIEFIKECVQDEGLGLDSWVKVKLIQSANDVEYIKKCIQDEGLGLDSRDKVELIQSTNDIEFIKACIQDEGLELESWYKVELIQSTNDVEYIKKCIQDKGLGLLSSDKVKLIQSTNDVEYIKKCIQDEGLELESWYKVVLIQSTNDVEYIKKCIQDEGLGLDSRYKVELIKSTNDVEYIKKCIQDEGLGLDSRDKVELISLTKDIEFIKECIQDEILEIDEKVLILLRLNDKDKLDVIKEIENQRKEIVRKIRILGGFDGKTTEENLDLILQWENVQNPKEKAKVLSELKEKNQEILQKIDFKILDEEYLKILGKEKINVISNFPDIQDKILKLNKNELKAYSKIIESYEKEDDIGWRYLTINILNNISSYNNIISEIDNFTKKDIESLMLVLQNSNTFGLKNLEDLRNYREIKQEKCDEWINDSFSSTIRKKEALLYKLFGQDINYTEKILKQYGQDIETIENEDIKYYILALKQIMQISDNETIEKIYQEIPEIALDNVNKTLMEKSISNEYEKLYNKGLLKIENLKTIEENVYDAGTDFNILMTSIGAYAVNNDIKDYKKDWNRPSLNSPHVCCSYIRNDMIGTAPIRGICYGFNEMEPYSLVESNCHDIWSNATGFISWSKGSKYYSPDNQINKTKRYNEMDYARFQNGRKKQPDYIIVFKERGQVQNLEEAKKASKDWGGMPIVVIDKDKCLETERSKLDNLLEKYREGDKSLASEIYYKIRNNRVTRGDFAKEINMDEFKREMEEEENNREQIKSKRDNEVTKEDMKINSERVSAEERKQEMSKIEQLYLQIHSITKDDKDFELE